MRINMNDPMPGDLAVETKDGILRVNAPGGSDRVQALAEIGHGVMRNPDRRHTVVRRIRVLNPITNKHVDIFDPLEELEAQCH